MEVGTLRLKVGLAEMLKGGVIMDVTNAEQAKIAEDAGAVAVMALERVPSDIRRDGGVARMSPVKLTAQLSAEEVDRLFQATRDTLVEWRDRLRAEAGEGFPEKVTAFRPEMAVHGRYGKPCPSCGSRVQRIVYAENETNYCPRCQTGGKLLADRSLSRLLKEDWPRTVDELEHRQAARSAGLMPSNPMSL